MEQVKIQLFLLIVLVLGIKAPVAQGCTCLPAHLQDHFCHSQIVIRAKIIGQKTATQSMRLYGAKTIEYKIKLIKTFKGFDKVDNIQYVYTPFDDSLCGVRLDAENKVQYLLSGYLWNEKVMIELCGVNELWENLSLSQKKNLKYRYQKGCECQIRDCYTSTCRATSANECVWYPFSRESLQGVCMKRTNGSCNWYTEKSDNVRQNGMGETSMGVLEVSEHKPTETLQ